MHILFISISLFHIFIISISILVTLFFSIQCLFLYHKREASVTATEYECSNSISSRHTLTLGRESN